MGELAQYRSREVVRAGRIESIVRQQDSGDWRLVLEGGEHRDVGPEFYQTWDPEVGDWYVDHGKGEDIEAEIMRAGELEAGFELID